MPIKMQCPGCAAPLTFPDQAEGKRARCTSCQVVLTVTKPKVAAPTSESPTATAATDGGLMLGMLEEDLAARKKRVASGEAGDDAGQYGVSEPRGEAPSKSRLAAITAIAGGDPDRVGGLGVRARPMYRANNGPVSAAGELLEGLVGIASLLLSLGGFGYSMFAAINAVEKGAWLIVTLYTTLFVLFFAIVVPGCIAAMKAASVILKFELPESPYYRMAVVVCFPSAMATLGNILGSTPVAIVMGIGGCLLATVVLWLMYRLRPLEWLLGATLTSVAFVPLVIVTVMGAAMFTGWLSWRVEKWNNDAEIAKAREEAKKQEAERPKQPVLFDLVSETEAKTPIPESVTAMTITQDEADRLSAAVRLGNVSIRLPQDVSLTESNPGTLAFVFRSAAMPGAANEENTTITITVSERAVAGQYRPVVGWPKASASDPNSRGGAYAEGMYGFRPFTDTTTQTAIDYLRIGSLAATRARLTLADRKREIERYVVIDGPSILSVTITSPVSKREQNALATASVATLKKADGSVAGFGAMDDARTLLELAARGYDEALQTIRLGEKHHEAIVEATGSSDAGVRAFAMRWVPILPREQAMPLLESGLKDASPRVRREAIVALETKMHQKVDAVTRFLTDVTFEKTEPQQLLRPICGPLYLPRSRMAFASDPFDRVPSETPPSPAAEPRRAEVSQAIASRLESAAAKDIWIWAMALGMWGDEKYLAALRTKYNHPDLTEDAKLGLILGMANLKDAETRIVLLGYLSEDKPGAAEGLIHYAPGIEKDVLAAMRQSDASARQAIAILSKIGTRQSLATLNSIAEGNSSYASAARAAADAIRERLRGEKDKTAPAPPPTSPAPDSP